MLALLDRDLLRVTIPLEDANVDAPVLFPPLAEVAVNDVESCLRLDELRVCLADVCEFARFSALERFSPDLKT